MEDYRDFCSWITCICILIWPQTCGGQGVEYGSSLNENGSHRLIYVGTWFLLGGSILEGLEAMTLCHHGIDFYVSKDFIPS